MSQGHVGSRRCHSATATLRCAGTEHCDVSTKTSKHVKARARWHQGAAVLAEPPGSTTIAKELDGFEQGGATPAVLDEMATQLSCRLDAIDVGDSATLRELRRAQLRRCEQLCSKL